jgi:hypothetical protein
MLFFSRLFILAAFFLLYSPPPAIALQERLLSIPTRPGVTVRALLLQPERPVAAVILFSGGHGALRLRGPVDRPTIGWGKNNFLVRTRHTFAARGFLTAVVDAPSDQSGDRGMLGGFRASAEHAQDIEAVMAALKKRAAVPIWLIGTSRGTESVANAATRIGRGIGGIVLTSPMTEPNRGGPDVLSMEIEAIRVPVLLVAHERDECRETPPAGTRRIAERLINASAVKVNPVKGGDPPRSKPCEALSPHGFLGVEGEVVHQIAAFIKAHLPPSDSLVPPERMVAAPSARSPKGRGPGRRQTTPAEREKPRSSCTQTPDERTARATPPPRSSGPRGMGR